ncbi:M2 family metallopeptidase [Novosphingobium sp. FKTRR1]|uniref:M2 family metallopeptidase n=1 Tax=Novosphingobium sp. FKTRR1 TaxID=2879118 RepID=UPI001CF09465|nr:M2 family metallopeptidase [Novosphingobium sp. FKTRR1]
MNTRASLLALALAMLAQPAFAADAAPTGPASSPVTPATVDAWLAKADKAYFDQTVIAGRNEWIAETYITDDTESLAADTNAAMSALQVELATQAAGYAKVPGLSPEVQRKLVMIRTGITSPVPADPALGAEFARLQARIQGLYGKGKGTLKGQPINGSDIEAAMGTSRNPDETREMWISWHDAVGKPMKADYVRMVEIANQGARELGFADVGAQWRSNYDMDPDAFATLTDKIWGEVKPLYLQLHCYTRAKLNAKYGDAVQGKSGPIRGDLLGNMWGQSWGNIYDVVAPAGAGDLGYDIGDLLTAKGYDPVKMVKAGEGFYSSLGFAPLPATFWERAQITKPRDREVVCHASAWDIDNKSDLRIKMCTKVNSDDFVTIHHELGHNYYQRAYSNQPSRWYMEGANDGFHEAIGDTMALSITPEYLVQIGLLDRAKVPGPDKDTGLLLRQALNQVAFLPFGLLVDRWRWGVFSGKVKPEGYEAAWNDLRRQYQGIVPPVERGADAFDPGAKFHVPAVVPYTRYFLAGVLKFQFYEAACKQAGWTGPLHRCSFYGNKAVGQKLDAMLSMGASKPWPDALEAFTGSRQISGASLVRYFAPLQKWLETQNKGRSCGW